MASTRPSSRTSPPRKPLHERSDSQTNERTSPTLRPIGEPEAHVYTTSPFPSLPSHILHPKGGGRQGFVFEDDEMGVSDHGPKIVQEHEIQAIAPLRIRKAKDGARERDGNHASRSRHSYHERSFFTAPTPSLPHRLSQPTPQELDARAHFAAMKHSRAGAEPITEELIPLPIIPRRDEALGSHRHPQDFKVVPQPTPQAPIATRSSDASLSSAESTGTVVRTKPRPSGGSYSAFPIYPRSGSSMSNSSVSASSKQASSKSDEDFSPGSPVSPISPVLSAFSSPHTRRAPSTSQTSHRHVSSQDGIKIQYPAVRSPSASKLWAESSPSEAIARPPRHPNRGSGRWNPHLSAVPSEDTEERNSGTMRRPDSSNPSDAHYASFPSNTRMLPPHPALLTVTRDVTDSTIRVVNEREDAGTALPPLPVPESRGSSYPGYTGRSLQDARRNTLQPRPSSRGSFRRDGIPAWARVYYGRPSTSSRPPTRTSASTDRLSRPRTRPHRIPVPERDIDSMAISPAEASGVVVEVRGGLERKPSQVWSPHLWHDRRCMGRRRSMFQPPRLDEHAMGTGVRRRNAQICLFALGFIFPFAWFIAAVLPLPPKPRLSSKEPEKRLSRLEIERDLEKALGVSGEARYENARWWRKLNRGMSVLGVLILAAIIALAVVAVHMRNR